MLFNYENRQTSNSEETQERTTITVINYMKTEVLCQGESILLLLIL